MRYKSLVKPLPEMNPKTVVIDSALFVLALRTRRMEELFNLLEGIESLSTCDIVKVEVKSGVIAPKSEQTRKVQMEWYLGMFEEMPSRTMDWDLCETAIELAAQARRKGFQVKADDALVAAAAVKLGAEVATANVAHFTQMGLQAFNPLKDASAQSSPANPV